MEGPNKSGQGGDELENFLKRKKVKMTLIREPRVLGNKGVMLQKSCVMVAQGKRNSSTEKNEWKINGKNAWHSKQHHCENGPTITHTKARKWRSHLETMRQRYRNLV